jgi:predicted ATPase
VKTSAITSTCGRRQLKLLTILHDYCKQGAQFVIATHSPIIMAYPDARIYLLGEEGIREVPYQETEHYLVTRGFPVNPQRTLNVLLSDDMPGKSGAPADGAR